MQPPPNDQNFQRRVQQIISWQDRPGEFIEDIWQLTKQPLKPEYRELAQVVPLQDIKMHWFEPFQDTKHLTWQQSLIVMAVERAISKKGPRRISVESGHGTGKSAVIAMLMLWFLFCHKDAQVPCTAPTSEQMHDILWKEAAKWLDRMPESVKACYEWQSDYVRMRERPETWFARAKTARKENTEALAGVHGEFVMLLVDEASGVPEEIFETAEGSLTGKDVVFIMISNHTRNIGYFHESHKSGSIWQRLRLNSEESPIVDKQWLEDMRVKGQDSDVYRVRVLGLSPREETIDTAGYVPLLIEADLRRAPDERFVGTVRMGIDPSGEGDDITAWIIRDQFKAKIIATEPISTSRSIAQKTITLMEHYGVKPEDVFCDNFGVGANVAQELALTGRRINGINVGDASESERFENKRAEFSWRMRDWARGGGELVHVDQWEEILTVKYMRTLRDRIKIMSKKEMRKQGIKSPNKFDALMLTFAFPDKDKYGGEVQRVKIEYDKFGRPIVRKS